jgi:hypothetical protein
MNIQKVATKKLSKKTIENLKKSQEDMKKGNTLSYKEIFKKWEDRSKLYKAFWYTRRLLFYIEFRPFWRMKMWYQRIKRGWCEEDIWSLYDYLGTVISDTLRKLQEDTSGYPIEMASLKEWKQALLKMAKAFEMARDGDEKHLNDFERYGIKRANKLYKERRRKWEQDMKLFVKFFENLWD